MAIKTKTFTLLSFIFAVACLVCLIISFASDRWVVSTQKEVSGFENIGLWSACFKSYRPPPWSLVDRYYDGCWWVFDREMDDLRHFLFPSWFRATQGLVTFSLVLQLLVIIVMIVNAINCFPFSKFREKIKFVLSVTSSVMHGLTGVFLTIAVILFGARADNERTWLEKPDQNYLSWSFGMCVLAAFLAIITFMCQVLESCRVRLEDPNNEEPQVYLTNQPPPSTNYIYTRQKYPPSHNYDSKPNVGHPAYVSKYSNQGSTSSLNTKPPDTLFAVSGAGEVYINRLADYDENRQRGRNGYAPPYDRRPVNSSTYRDRDNTDAHRPQMYSSAHRAEEEDDYKLNDYEESKKMKQPVLPEYVPKTKATDTKKIILDNTLDESNDGDVKPTKKEKGMADSEDDGKKKKRTGSESKSKKTKSRSDSGKRSKKKGADTDDDKNSDAGHTRRRSKKRGNKSDTSDDERSRSRRRSKRGHSSGSKRRSSHSRERSHSRDRSRSRDLNSSYSDSYVDSDAGSARGRSRRKRSISEERTKKDSHKHSTSKDRHSKKKQNGNYTDDMSGSEYSSKRKSHRKGGGNNESGQDKRKRSRDFTDTESVRSKQSRHHGEKPKGTYSSYYEY